jgi:glycosyltransferase involved in cell wall biosynthesis
VKEIGLSLSAEIGRQINIYTPYEKTDTVIAPKLRVRAVQSRFSSLNVSNTAYSLIKKAYYSRTFSRFLLRAIKTSGSPFVDKMARLFVKDGVEAIQAEQDFSLPLAIRLGESLDLPVIADLHNITAEELVATGVLKPESPVYSAFQKSMKEWLTRVDFVCVVSKEMRNYVEVKYELPSHKILVVPPGGRLRNNNPPRKAGSKVIFAGSISYREHVDLYVESLPLVKEEVPEATFYSTNRGEDLTKMKSLCNELDIQMKWTWFSDEEDLLSFLCKCTVGILPSSSDVARVMGTPIKLFDYMSAGLPVVANRVGGWSELIEQENIGTLTNDDPKDFALAILRLLKDADLRTKLSQNATKVVREKYNWKRSVEPLAKFYENLS